MNSTGADDFKGTARFSVVRRLGAGGMGVVYEAFDRERNARVALKTLHQIDPDGLYRFKREFRSLAELVHPRLVPLYEFISDGSQWFFTMELVEGTNFLAHVRPPVPRRTAGSLVPPQDAPAIAAPAGATSQRSGATEPLTEAGPTEPTPDWMPPAALSLEKTTEQTEVPQTTPDLTSDQPTGAWDGDSSTVPQGPHHKRRETPPATRRPVDRCGLEAVDLARLRDAFCQLAEGVCALHAAGKLHRDLKPGNALVRKDGRVVLLDFGLVADLGGDPHCHAGTADPHHRGDRLTHHDTVDGRISGTFAYMAPEQAAAAPLTPASDWYAVGVMLFQALTGRLPFEGNTFDILRDKQCVKAPAPAELVEGVPDDLNALCVDLLRREPAARPGGAEILARLSGRVSPEAAPPPAGEVLPFVGRERHLAELGRAFDALLAGRTVVYHVHGRSGVGKSTLLQHFLDEMAHRRGAVVLTGRCYEQESVPYKAVDSLVDALTRYLLRLPVEEWLPLLPPDMPALARIFPVLNRVAVVADTSGEAEYPDLRELRRRAFAALRELLAGLAARRPLVLCIDDLQWGDVDSAELIAELLRPPDAPRLLLLLAYRSEYVGTSACLRALAATEAGPRVEPYGRLIVEALAPEETRVLALQLLGDGPDTAARADWVVRESGGSAFFIYELVRHLQEGRAQEAAEGVDLDEVLWRRVRRLPEEARRLLETVAVAGKPVRLRQAEAAAGVGSLPPEVVLALRSGHLVRTTGPHLDDDIESFHDRIRESVVTHLTPETRRDHHAGLAAALEAAGGADPETLAVHYHESGQSAPASRYYAAAAAQAVRALAFERAEEFFHLAAHLAPGDKARADICEQMIHFYTDLARFSDAYAAAREALPALGVTLPAKFVPPLLLLDFARAKLRLRGRKPADLLDLPAIADPRLEAAVRLMNAVAKAAYQVRPELCVAVATRIVNLCLKHGNTRDCAIGYMVFGAIFQGGVLGNHQAGYEFGRLALALVEKYGNDRQRAEVNFVVGYFGTSWLRPVAEAEELWRIAIRSGLETADWFHTGCACAGTVMSLHMRGVPMDLVLAESERFLDLLRRANLREPMGTILAVRQTIRNLRGQTRARTSWGDADFDEDRHLADLAGYGSRHFTHFVHVIRMQTLYLWGEYERALGAAEVAQRYVKESPGMLHGAEHDFYHGLILAALSPARGLWRRWTRRRTLNRIQRRMRRWAKQCPDNFLAKERLLAAEVCRVRGRGAEAAECYGAAVAAAERYGYLQVAALAHELLARFHLARGRHAEADTAVAAAVAAYRRWGATAYADALPGRITGLPASG